ncbi:MAG TPA: tetratricopeptide repeat protein [Steroidobacteraceae bacterium]|nr:tetratricopeptide repeat protein [Steroidobacteraceae bacterium]
MALAADAPKQQNSKAVGKILKDVQDNDLKNKRYADAINKLKEAQNTSGKTPYDQHLINDMLGFCYAHTNDYADAAKSWEAAIDDGFYPPADQSTRIRALSQAFYQVKNYDKAIEYGQRALKGGFGDAETPKIVAQSYYLKGDWKNTLHFEEPLIEAAIKNGGSPSNEALQLVLGACVKLDDGACVTKTLEKLVTYYPKPEYWYQLLYSLTRDTANSDTNTLQVFRLMLETDVLKSADDYIEMSQLAMDAGSPGEAQRVLQRGFEKNVFSDQRSKDKAQRLLDKAKQKSAADQATLDKAAREAGASQTGVKNNAMGIAYFGYGQYDKAVEQFSQAISKGQLKNAAETQLDLGISQLKAGHKDDAIKSFKAVKGEPVLERLASLWALHAREK